MTAVLVFGCQPCKDLSGVWLEGNNDCNGLGAQLHVAQNGCVLSFEEAPDYRGRVRGDKVTIDTPEGESCEGDVLPGHDGTFETILVRCMPSRCPFDYDRGFPTDWCPAGAPLSDHYEAVDAVGIDMLFVIGNSGPMGAAQDYLAEAFPDMIGRIIEPMTDPSTGLVVQIPSLDFHVGIISTDLGVAGYSVETCEENPTVGDDGILQDTLRGSGCTDLPRNYLTAVVDPMDETAQAATDALSRDFGCIEKLGTDGCKMEQPLEAAHRALIDHSTPGGPNAGFMRPDAILAIIFVAGEEDCSAVDPTIYDVQSLPYIADLQCYYSPEKLYALERYFRDFRGLKGSLDPYDVSENLIMGFLAGVPPDETACNGNGETIGECLDVPAMKEVVSPDGHRLEQVCRYPPGCTPTSSSGPGDCVTEAFPARRLVQVAQFYLDHAVVGSICTGDFRTALLTVADRIKQTVGKTTACRFDMRVDRPATRDPADACRCTVPCSVYETLDDDSPCQAPKTYVRLEAGEGSAEPRTVCEIPQVGFLLQDDCSADCNDPLAFIVASGSGWYYHAGEFLFLSGGFPEEGSTLTIDCCLP